MTIQLGVYDLGCAMTSDTDATEIAGQRTRRLYLFHVDAAPQTLKNGLNLFLLGLDRSRRRSLTIVIACPAHVAQHLPSPTVGIATRSDCIVWIRVASALMLCWIIFERVFEKDGGLFEGICNDANVLRSSEEEDGKRKHHGLCVL